MSRFNAIKIISFLLFYIIFDCMSTYIVKCGLGKKKQKTGSVKTLSKVLCVCKSNLGIRQWVDKRNKPLVVSPSSLASLQGVYPLRVSTHQSPHSSGPLFLPFTVLLLPSHFPVSPSVIPPVFSPSVHWVSQTASRYSYWGMKLPLPLLQGPTRCHFVEKHQDWQ